MKDNCPCIDCITLPICIAEMRKNASFYLRIKCSLLDKYCIISSLEDLQNKNTALKKVFKKDNLCGTKAIK